jgi:hypothetical protein
MRRPFGLVVLALACPFSLACGEKVQIRVANDKANDLRVELALGDGGAPVLSKVRVLAFPSDSVLWEAEGPRAAIDEISYGVAPADFNELSAAMPLAAGGQVSWKVSGDGLSGELRVSIKED